MHRRSLLVQVATSSPSLRLILPMHPSVRVVHVDLTQANEDIQVDLDFGVPLQTLCISLRGAAAYQWPSNSYHHEVRWFLSVPPAYTDADQMVSCLAGLRRLTLRFVCTPGQEEFDEMNRAMPGPQHAPVLGPAAQPIAL